MEKQIKRRKRQVFKFGWKDAKEIASYPDVKKSRLSIFLDIYRCFKRYYLLTNQYKNNKFWALTNSERDVLGKKLGKANKDHDAWQDAYHANWEFLCKWSSIEWQKSQDRIVKRNEAYTKQYGFGPNCYVQYGVTIVSEHLTTGELKVGCNILLARNVDIDYTGGLQIGNGVEMAEGVKILTHNHDFFGMISDDQLLPNTARAYYTPLVIEDNVFIGAHSIIMPGVKRIGANAIISPGSVVMDEAQPNTIYSGNPAKKIGKLPRVYYRYKK